LTLADVALVGAGGMPGADTAGVTTLFSTFFFGSKYLLALRDFGIMSPLLSSTI
jgi:hypothetical protein